MRVCRRCKREETEDTSESSTEGRLHIYLCFNFWARGYNEMKDGAEGGVRKLEGLYDKGDCRARCTVFSTGSEPTYM